MLRAMKPGRIEYVITDEDDLDVEVRLDGRRVGYLWCLRDGDRLKLADLRIDEDKFRHQGYGSGLLRFVLDRANALGIQEVWGVVTADDVRNTPYLLTWYERLGFAVSNAQPESDPDLKGGPAAIKKIVRRR